MFHTCVVNFDVTRNLKKFLNFACCSLQVALATSGWLWLPQRVASWRTARRSRPDGDEQGLSDFFFFQNKREQIRRWDSKEFDEQPQQHKRGSRLRLHYLLVSLGALQQQRGREGKKARELLLC